MQRTQSRSKGPPVSSSLRQTCEKMGKKDEDCMMPSMLQLIIALATVAIIAAAETASAQTPAAGTTPAADAAAPAPAADAAVTTDCERYTSAIAGGIKDKALLEKSELRTIVNALPELALCGAVKADSDALCKLMQHGLDATECRAKQSTFHELRTNPKGRGFMFNDVQFESCNNFEPLKPYCKTFREAARAGDAGKCAGLGEVASMCKALITMDKSLCQAPKGGAFEGKDKSKPDSGTYAQDMAKDCVQQIEKMADYGKGLKALAESSSPIESELAKAALGQADACSSWAKAAMPKCTAALENAANVPGAKTAGKAAAPPAKK